MIGTLSVIGEDDELSDDVAAEESVLDEVEQEALLAAASVVAVLSEVAELSEVEALQQSVLLDVAAAVASVGGVAGVVCAMVSMGTMPRAAIQAPAAAIRTNEVIIDSLS